MPTTDTHTFIYNALSQIDASMRKLQLEADGIEVVAVGGAGAIGFPEVPAKESLEVQLWVPKEQSVKAAEIMRTFDKERGESSGEEWTCSCGESNESQFQICWKCQADRPAS